MKRLLGCYPSLNLHDPETYITAMSATLVQYSYWVGERAVAKVSKTCKFPPSMADLVEILNEFKPSSISWVSSYDQRSAAQLAERERLATLPAPRQTPEEAAAEMAARGIFMFGPSSTESEFTPAKVKEKYGLTDAQWDAIPDAPPDSTWRKLKGNATT